MENETGTEVANVTDKDILEYLREIASPKLKARMAEENGESYCVSYIRKNIEDGTTTVPEAAGWLEQELAGN